ncbi:MAG: hypothetical protein QOG72_1149 [Sphingomonadales bacterium]|jgi:uncharacterized membrane protein YozB (DUF420 family)|nr:hypothetical protein [Sphingomonadales bacterium]
MATVQAPMVRWRNDRLFYTGASLYLAILTFAGFARSFFLSHWMTRSASTPEIGRLLVTHGLFFSAWIGLLVVQPILIANRRRELHRKLGWVGAALAVAMVVFGNLAAIAAMHGGFKGLGDPYAFYAVPFFAIQGFAVLVGLAVMWREKAETHKRLMLLAAIVIVEAAVARIELAPVVAGAPFTFFVAGDLLIFAGMAYDKLSRGRVHKAWIWGGAAVIASQIGKVLISHTEPWMAFGRAVAGLWPV